MCDVGTAISTIGLGLQGASVIKNYISDKQATSAYSDYQALQTQATISNYIQQTQAINTRYAQEQEASGLNVQQIYLKNLQAKATAQASAAASGVEGSTIDNLFRGYDRASAVSNYVAARNLQMQGMQYNDETESMRISAISSINMQQQYNSTGASTLLSGLGGMMTSYANYDERKERMEYYRGK